MGEKAAEYVELAKEKVVSTVGKAKDMYEENKSAIPIAVDAGKETYEKEVHKP